MKWFVDLDGVLADFATHYTNTTGLTPNLAADDVDWKLVHGVPGFYRNMPPMLDAAELWNAIKGFNPTVLTGVPKSVPGAAADKVAWCAQHLGANVPVITCASRDKCKYGGPGTVLIDDWNKYKHLWVAAGGTWIAHTSAANTIKLIKALDT